MYQFSWDINFPDVSNFSQYFVGTSFADFAVGFVYLNFNGTNIDRPKYVFGRPKSNPAGQSGRRLFLPYN